MSKNYKLISLGNNPRIELKEALGLTGCEISVNSLPAGVSVPFVHSHQQNEEVYLILEGRGELYIDGEEIKVNAGDVIRISPKGERCFKAAADSAMKFICIQTKEGSLEQFTNSDGNICQSKPSWL